MCVGKVGGQVSALLLCSSVQMLCQLQGEEEAPGPHLLYLSVTELEASLWLPIWLLAPGSKIIIIFSK